MPRSTISSNNNNKAGAINYYKDHPDKSVYTVKYLRNGREMTKTFVAPPNK